MSHRHESSFEPSPFLVEHASILPKGRALDIAMGNGRNAIYLAQQGYEVEGVDIAPDAVAKAVQSAKQAGVTIKAVVADLEKDFYIQKDTYDVIICFYYLQRSLIPRIKEGLRQGGVVAYETFTIDQLQYGKPRHREYLLQPNELLDVFRDFRVLHYREGTFNVEGDTRAIASLIARKMV